MSEKKIAGRPQFTHDEAARIVENMYGRSPAAIQKLPSDRDQNFHLTIDSGEGFVLKIANAGEAEEMMDLQNSALQHLAKDAPSLSIPRICLTRDNSMMTTAVNTEGKTHFVRLLTYLPGRLLAHVQPHSPALFHDLGRFLGRLNKALVDFEHPAARRPIAWDLQQADKTIQAFKNHITEPKRLAIIETFLDQFQQVIKPLLPSLRQGIIHNDANDYNLLAHSDVEGQSITGIVDFGDMVHTTVINEIAIASAYGLLEKRDPITAVSHIIGGYHEVYPLTEQEISLLFPLICIRLCISVVMSAYQQQLEPDNAYLCISEQPAWDALERLITISPELAHYSFRHACGLPPCPQTSHIVNWLHGNDNMMGPVVEHDLAEGAAVFDLSIGSLALGDLGNLQDQRTLAGWLKNEMAAVSAKVGIGRYNEARPLYTDRYRAGGEELPEWGTIHLGMDLFVGTDTAVFAPLTGHVHKVEPEAMVLVHNADGVPFFTLYRHLIPSPDLETGMILQKGDQLGQVTDRTERPSHLHFQIVLDLLGWAGDFPGTAVPSQRDIWLSLCPDPHLILDITTPYFEEMQDRDGLLATRRERLGKSLSLSYQEPLKIVRGWQQYLYDETGQPYLDLVNNVCHVGHCHPHVTNALNRQTAVLNTNTRYLHDNIINYANKLCATLPDPLNVCFFVCSGSEANELALRLAHTYTGHQDIIVIDGGYHGNTATLIDISPYKFDGPGGQGAPPHIHKALMPDPCRGPYKDDPQAGEKYAAHVQSIIEQIQDHDRGIAAFIGESLLGCGGQIVLPAGYFQAVYEYVREAEGVCIADEVQVGFGRVGSHFWGFETQGVVPDIVTLGKPIGNGHPLAAVVTTQEIADAFANGMEYFNTFGGNPVSCAVGTAVLEVIERENLQEHALELGKYFQENLTQLMETHPIIGDVRGLGLFIGVELVLDRKSMEPAGAYASYVAERMKAHGILISTDGPYHNVLKIKPPLVVDQGDVDYVVSILDKVLGEDALKLNVVRET